MLRRVCVIIHKGELQGHESYPYMIKKTLFDESEGRILLDLSHYHYSEEKAEELERMRMEFKPYSDTPKTQNSPRLWLQL